MDVNVVIEARKGDREAFGRLMAEIRPALMAQACAILKDEFIADECVSETMMRIFEKLPCSRAAPAASLRGRAGSAPMSAGSEYRRVRRDLSLQSVQEPSVSDHYQLTELYLAPPFCAGCVHRLSEGGGERQLHRAGKGAFAFPQYGQEQVLPRAASAEERV